MGRTGDDGRGRARHRAAAARPRRLRPAAAVTFWSRRRHRLLRDLRDRHRLVPDGPPAQPSRVWSRVDGTDQRHRERGRAVRRRRPGGHRRRAGVRPVHRVRGRPDRARAASSRSRSAAGTPPRRRTAVSRRRSLSPPTASWRPTRRCPTRTRRRSNRPPSPTTGCATAGSDWATSPSSREPGRSACSRCQFARAAGATDGDRRRAGRAPPGDGPRARRPPCGGARRRRPASWCDDLTAGRGADVVFECAGVAPLLQTAVDLTRRGGVTAMLGYIAGEATITPASWLGKNIRMVASTAFVHEDLHHTMSLIADGRVRVAPLHTRSVGLDELESVLADLAAGRADDTKVLVDPARSDGTVDRTHRGDHRRRERPRPGDGRADGGRGDAARARRHRGRPPPRRRRGLERRRRRRRRPAGPTCPAPTTSSGLAAAAFDRFGAVHVLCNNAGVVKRARAWEPHGRRLAVGARGRPVERDPRRPRVRSADARASPRAATSSTPRRCPVCSRSPTWPRTASPSRRSWPCPRRCSSTSTPRARAIGVSVLCPGFIATRITESERNRPADLDRRGARAGRRAHHGGGGGDDGRRRGRRSRRRRDPRRSLLDPDPRGLPRRHPGARRRDRDRRPPDAPPIW